MVNILYYIVSAVKYCLCMPPLFCLIILCRYDRCFSFLARSFDFAKLQASIDHDVRTPLNNVVDIDNVKPDHLASPVYAQDIIDHVQVSNSRRFTI